MNSLESDSDDHRDDGADPDPGLSLREDQQHGEPEVAECVEDEIAEEVRALDFIRGCDGSEYED
jgi:hypothetical protein